jgi:predicted RNase H-like nuclease (RuvC/YqgF family)
MCSLRCKETGMKTRDFFLLATLLVAILAWSAPLEAQKVYRWVDENGVVHFGDAIPPEYSTQRHEVVDGRGVRTVVNEPVQAKATPVRDDRDRVLLASYGSVAEIEDVRDRRVGYLESQNEVALERLENLRARQAQLDDNPAAMNERMLVERRIGEYDREIERRNGEIERMRAQFDDDIKRFRELRGLPGPE